MYTEDEAVNPVTGTGGMTTEHAAAAIVLSALAFLILVNRGFRGVGFGGASISVR